MWRDDGINTKDNEENPRRISCASEGLTLEKKDKREWTKKGYQLTIHFCQNELWSGWCTSFCTKLRLTILNSPVLPSQWENPLFSRIELVLGTLQCTPLRKYQIIMADTAMRMTYGMQWKRELYIRDVIYFPGAIGKNRASCMKDVHCIYLCTTD